MKRIRRLLQGRSKGLTLVEIIIAIALIAIIGVAILGGLSQAIYSLHIADVRTTAESLARSEMEVVYEAAYDLYESGSPPSYSKAGEESDIYEGYYVWVTAFPIDPEPIDPEAEPEARELIVDPITGEFLEGYDEDLGIQEITVTVVHHERDEVITLIGYKADRNA